LGGGRLSVDRIGSVGETREIESEAIRGEKGDQREEEEEENSKRGMNE
jgi:hypothetical protein